MARRIDVLRLNAGESRGTGFLVSRDRVLTALHVVGSVRAGELRLHGPVKLTGAAVTDGDVRFPVCICSDPAAFEAFPELDLVCITVDPGVFSTTKVFTLGDSSKLAEHDPWDTFGFPETVPDDGKGTGGTVQSTSALVEHRGSKRERIQLYSLEAGTGGHVRGYSGAPVIVRGGVVAVMSVAASSDGERSVEGTLYGVPLAPLAARLGLRSRALPKVASDIQPPAEPFRGLQRFRREHAQVLFGRDGEIEDVIAAIERTPLGIVLLTGQAGAGKSSLLEAGVLPRLESTYECLLARVEQQGLRGAWKTAVAGDWLQREEAAGKPLLVVIDQLEDAWTSDGRILREWIESDLARCIANGTWLPRGRLILSFRKEWSAEIQGVLNETGLPSWEHVNLKPLRRSAIIDIVHALDKHPRYGVQVETGLGERVADVLLADPEAPIAPTLQIWLSELYARRKRWTQSLFDALLRDGASLAEHVDRQLRTLPKNEVESGFALDLLAFHVTPLGSSAARTHQARAAAYRGSSHSELARKLADAALLVPLERANGYRLIHDTLGPVVVERVAVSRRLLQRGQRFFNAVRLDWLAAPEVDDARGRLGPLFDGPEVDVVDRGLAAFRQLDKDDDALVSASAVAQIVSAASKQPAPTALGTLLTDTSARPSPSADHLVSQLASPHLRPLSRTRVGLCGLATSGNVLAFTIAPHEVSIVDTKHPQATYAVDGLAAPRALTVSRRGDRVLVASAQEVCVIDTQTGRRRVLPLATGDGTTFWISDAGDILLQQAAGLFWVPDGAEQHSWRVRVRTDDDYIHTVHGITYGVPHAVYQATHATQEYLLWRGPDGREHSLPIPDDAVLRFHPEHARVAIMSPAACVAYVLDLETHTKLDEIDDQRLKDGDATETAHRMHTIGFDARGELLAVMTVFDDYKNPEQTLVVSGTGVVQRVGYTTAQAAWLADGDLYVLESKKLTRFQGDHEFAATLEASDALGRSAKVAGHSRTAIAYERHDDHVHVVQVVFGGRGANVNAEQLLIADTGLACAIIDGRPFLLGDNVAPGFATLSVPPAEPLARDARTVKAADLVNGVVVFTDGSAVVDDRRASVGQLEAGEEVAFVTRRGATCLALTDQNRILAFGDAGPAPYELVAPSGSGPPAAFAISPDGRLLLAGGLSRNAGWPLQLWRLDAGPRRRESHVLQIPNVGGMGPDFAFSPDGQFLATSCDDPIVAVWDLRSDPARQVLHVIDHRNMIKATPREVLGLAFTPDNRLVVVWGSGAVDRFELNSNEPVLTFPPAGGEVVEETAIFSPDGRWCVLDRSDGRTLLATADLRPVHITSPAELTDIAFAIDNQARWLVTGKNELRWLGPIDPYSAPLGRRSLGSPRALSLAPDGSAVTLLDDSGAVVRMNLRAMQCLREGLVIPWAPS